MTFVFDLDALCDFAAHVARETCTELGLELEEEHWPVIVGAVRAYIDAAIDRAAFAAEATAALNALPVTQEGVTQDGVQHRTEFGL